MPKPDFWKEYSKGNVRPKPELPTTDPITDWENLEPLPLQPPTEQDYIWVQENGKLIQIQTNHTRRS